MEPLGPLQGLLKLRLEQKEDGRIESPECHVCGWQRGFSHWREGAEAQGRTQQEASSSPAAQVQEHRCLENRRGSGSPERERHWILPQERRRSLLCTSWPLKEMPKKTPYKGGKEARTARPCQSKTGKISLGYTADSRVLICKAFDKVSY